MPTLYSSLRALLCGCIAAPLLLAQSPSTPYGRQSLAAEFLEGVTAGPNSYHTSPRDTPGYGVIYLVRLRRWLALEAGFNQLVHPVGSSICCEYNSNANDQLFLVPFGARLGWQSESSRFSFSLGGGGAYVRHSFGTQSLGEDLISSAGWAGQAVGSVHYSITRSGRLRAGVIARYYTGSLKESEGPGNGFPAPNDPLHIIVFGPELVFSFH